MASKRDNPVKIHFKMLEYGKHVYVYIVQYVKLAWIQEQWFGLSNLECQFQF